MKTIEQQVKEHFAHLTQTVGCEAYPVDPQQIESIKEQKKAIDNKCLIGSLIQAALGLITTVLMLYLIISGIQYAWYQEDKLPRLFTTVGALVAVLIAMTIGSVQKAKLERNNRAKELIDELETIETNPDLCKNILNWSNKYDAVQTYIDHLALQKRMPTKGEHHALKDWVDLKNTYEDVDKLKEKMQLTALI